MLKNFFFAIAAFALIFTACETPQEEKKTAGKLHITSETSIETGAIGNCFMVEYVIDEVAEGATISTRSTVDWMHQSGDITDTNIFFCTDTNTGEARTGEFIISYGDATVTITVMQRLNKIYLTSNATIDVPAEGTTTSATYAIREAIAGGEVTAYSFDGWIHLAGDITESEVPFSIDANTGEARTGTLTIDYAGDPAVITINQAAGL